MPLVSKIVCFFLLFVLFFTNITLQANPYYDKNTTFLQVLGGSITTTEEDLGFMQVSNNPASNGIFGITATGEDVFVASIVIKDLNENIVFSKTYNTQTISLDVSSLVQGEYIMTLTHSTQGTKSFRMSIY